MSAMNEWVVMIVLLGLIAVTALGICSEYISYKKLINLIMYVWFAVAIGIVAAIIGMIIQNQN